MIDGRAATGVLLVALGSIVVVAGTAPVLDVALWLVEHAGVLLLGLAVALALWRAMPRDAWKGPLALAGTGVVVLLVQQDVDLLSVVGGTVMGFGALLAVLRPSGVFRDDVDPVHTYRRVLYSRRIAAQPTSHMPQQIKLLAVLTVVRIDLSAVERGTDPFLELVLTGWFAIVKIELPSYWYAVAGRVAATRGVGFEGELDSSRPFTDLEDPEQQKRLMAVVRKHHGERRGAEERAVRVVIHMAGALSRVRLLRRQYHLACVR